MTLRTRFKASVERGCVRAGLPAVGRLGHRRDVLILAYHNVIPDALVTGGERALLHVPRALFARHLELLQETHDIVPLSAALNGEPASGRRPRAVITFDDAYRGAVTLGVQELARRGMAATIFVAPAYVGGDFFWWDLLTRHGECTPPEPIRQRALEECRGMEAAVRHWAEESGYEMRRLPAVGACASLEELRAAAAQPGITLASHSWSHPNLSQLASPELETELARPLAWLRERFESVLPVLAYPYGLSSPTVERVAAATGYRAAVRVAGGWMSHRLRNPFAIPRLSVPAGLSADGFRLWTAWPIRS